MPGKRRTIRALVGGASLIGTGKERPVAWGNYFWLDAGPRVVNMWAENLIHLDLKEVEGWWWGDPQKDWSEESGWFMVDDPRVGKEWLYQKLCFTGGSVPPKDILEEMYAFVGDEFAEELERYISPETYWPKHNGEVLENGIIRISWPPAPKPDVSKKVTMVETQELKAIHGLDAEKELADIIKKMIEDDMNYKTPKPGTPGWLIFEAFHLGDDYYEYTILDFDEESDVFWMREGIGIDFWIDENVYVPGNGTYRIDGIQVFYSKDYYGEVDEEWTWEFITRLSY